MRIEGQRVANFEPYAKELSKIDSSQYVELTSRIRPIVREMALPLRRSARTMSFGSTSKGDEFVEIDRAEAEMIARREISDKLVTFECHIRSFDRDSGVGKLTAEEFSRSMNFTIPLTRRTALTDAVIEAMKLDKVTVSGYNVIDGSGATVSFIFEQVELDVF